MIRTARYRLLIALLTFAAITVSVCGLLRTTNAQQSAPKFTLGAVGAMGFVIQSVEFGSTAEKSGLQPGDVILFINGQQVNSTEDVKHAISSANGVMELNLLRPEKGTGKMVGRTVKIEPAARQ